VRAIFILVRKYANEYEQYHIGVANGILAWVTCQLELKSCWQLWQALNHATTLQYTAAISSYQ